MFLYGDEKNCRRQTMDHVSCSMSCDETVTLKQFNMNHATNHISLKRKRRHICRVKDCGAAFETPKDLKRHMLTHTGERPHVCPVGGCGAAFTQSGGLKTHALTHTGERPHVCAVGGCGAAFTTGGALKNHALVHTGERPHFCTVDGCGKRFTMSGHLKTHMFTHTGERPYVCTVDGCGRDFTTSGNLKNHTLTHTGERPHVCTVGGCGAAFTLKKDLKTHTLIHTGERPHVCTVNDCGAAFTQRSNLKDHITRIHSEEGQQRQKREEERVAKLFTSRGIDFKREHHVDFSCWGGTWARTDFVVIQNGGVLIVEVDEYQHDGYGIVCDVARMGGLFQAFLIGGNTIPVGIIRYNPHTYAADGHPCKVLKKDRETRLAETVRGWQFAASGTLQIQYMYYDTKEGDLAICSDPLYPDTMKRCCLPCVN